MAWQPLACIDKWKPFPPVGSAREIVEWREGGCGCKRVDWLRAGCLILVQRLRLVDWCGLTLKEQGYSSSVTCREVSPHTHARGRNKTSTADAELHILHGFAAAGAEGAAAYLCE